MNRRAATGNKEADLLVQSENPHKLSIQLTVQWESRSLPKAIFMQTGSRGQGEGGLTCSG